MINYENAISNSFSENAPQGRSQIKARWERKRLQSSTFQNSATPSKSKTPSKKEAGDRFIPVRSGTRLDQKFGGASSSNGDKEESDDDETTDSKQNAAVYNSVLAATLDIDSDANSRILAFKEKAPVPKQTSDSMKILYSQNASRKSSSSSKLISRHIPSAPTRILDAPDILDDYYLNLLSWSDKNVLAVALAQTVYLWNASSGEINELMTFEDTPESYVSSLQWVQEGGQHIAIGTSDGKTQLWDVAAEKQLRSMDGHTERVSSMSWNKHMLSTGGRDSIVVNHDVRVARHNVATLKGHTQEVCGLEWSPDGSILASGGNDNKLCLWDASSTASSPKFTCTDHQAAVKALAWSPHERNLLATGGGTADRCIKFWNGQTGSLLNSIDTGSQVCALQWNKHEKEILSSHGFAQNQLCLWKYPTMAKVKELNGHSARVLHMAQSPDGTCVVSAAADETLRFWNVFEAPKVTGGKRSAGVTIGSKNKKMSKTMHIR